MRAKDIHGNYISNVIGYCHYNGHPGALNHSIAWHKKCKGKHCRHLEIIVHEAWERQKYRNRRPKR